MRLARIKPDYTDCFMHVYNRSAGTSADRPFDDTEKEFFIRRLKKLTKYYVIDVISYLTITDTSDWHQDDLNLIRRYDLQLCMVA